MEERYAPDHTFKLGDTISIYREHSQKISLRLIRTNVLEIGFLYKEVELFFFKGMKVDNIQDIPAREIHNWLKGGWWQDWRKGGRWLYELKLLEEPTYSIGDRFYHPRTQKEYILASVGAWKVVLINLEEGTRWSNPVKVDSIVRITQEEFTLISQDIRFTKKEDIEINI